MSQRVSFEAWMQQVDARIERKCGMSHDDLPDIAYRDLYDAGESAEEAATQALEEIGQ